MFATVEQSLTIVKQYCQLEDDDNTHDLLLSIFLEDSKAVSKTSVATSVITTDVNGDTVSTITYEYPYGYRPFIVAAKFLGINPLREGVIQASGSDTVTWQSQDKTIAGLLSMQRSFDTQLKNIPNGWSTVDKSLHTLGAFLG